MDKKIEKTALMAEQTGGTTCYPEFIDSLNDYLCNKVIPLVKEMKDTWFPSRQVLIETPDCECYNHIAIKVDLYENDGYEDVSNYTGRFCNSRFVNGKLAFPKIALKIPVGMNGETSPAMIRSALLREIIHSYEEWRERSIR